MRVWLQNPATPRKIHHAATLVALLALTVLPALAGASERDANHDGLADSVEGTAAPAMVLDDATLAIVDTGDASVGIFQTRLAGLGYTVTAIAFDSDYAVLSTYDLVMLPSSHGNQNNLPNFQALAQDYIDYVANGGRLYVCQPNPFPLPPTAITWVPFELVLGWSYNSDDCPQVIVNPDHCVANGITGGDLPFPGDTVISMGPEWDIVTEGPVTGNPSVFTAQHGVGAILVELGHPSSGAVCAYTDAGLANMIMCLLEGGPVANEPASWSGVKSLFR